MVGLIKIGMEHVWIKMSYQSCLLQQPHHFYLLPCHFLQYWKRYLESLKTQTLVPRFGLAANSYMGLVNVEEINLKNMSLGSMSLYWNVVHKADRLLVVILSDTGDAAIYFPLQLFQTRDHKTRDVKWNWN